MECDYISGNNALTAEWYRNDFGLVRRLRLVQTGPDGEPLYTLLLLGLGLRQLSVVPHNIPEIKKLIRSSTLQEANQVAQEALRMETARDVNSYLREQTRRLLPELFN